MTERVSASPVVALDDRWGPLRRACDEPGTFTTKEPGEPIKVKSRWGDLVNRRAERERELIDAAETLVSR